MHLVVMAQLVQQGRGQPVQTVITWLRFCNQATITQDRMRILLFIKVRFLAIHKMRIKNAWFKFFYSFARIFCV